MKTPKNRQKISHFSSTSLWFYGVHASLAALKNPKRSIHQLLLTQNAFDHLQEKERSLMAKAKYRIVAARELESCLPQGAIHQGIAVQLSPLPSLSLEDILKSQPDAPLVILDQVTDPQNIGAILRSAAAFGAAAVMLTDRNAPEETGAMAKAASGALDIIPVIRLPNLAKALATLKEHRYWCIGLDGHATETVEKALEFSHIAMVLGAEGKGLRRLTRESCDLLVKLPMKECVESLNVSNAAAIMLYAFASRKTGVPRG